MKGVQLRGTLGRTLKGWEVKAQGGLRGEGGGKGRESDYLLYSTQAGP